MSYESDQGKFLSYCKKTIPNFRYILQEAKRAKEEAQNACIDEIKKINTGSFAGNQVFLRELKRLGKEDYKA